MFTIRTFINSLSTRSVSILLTFICIGLLMGCTGDISGPNINFSADGFKVSDPEFTMQKTFETEILVESHSSVNIAAINGEVMVTGNSDAETVVVVAHLIVGSDSQADADRHIDDLEVLVTNSANEILIQTVQPQNTGGREHNVEYDIIVPSDFAVTTTQVNGSIDIVDIENSVDVWNTNGDVLLSDIVGGVAADVVNGSIAATVTLPVHETIDLTTDNGSIELRIPHSTSAVLGASVVIGAIITSNLEFADLVQTSHTLTGTLDNGEGVIELWAGNGNINVIGFN